MYGLTHMSGASARMAETAGAGVLWFSPKGLTPQG